jgi:hypothetical protein
MEKGIDYHALIAFIEDNWVEFEEYCSGEESAEATLEWLKKECGMK